MVVTRSRPGVPSEVRRSWIAIGVFVACTLFVWVGRIRNALVDPVLQGSDRVGPLLLATSFVVPALVLAAGWVLTSTVLAGRLVGGVGARGLGRVDRRRLGRAHRGHRVRRRPLDRVRGRARRARRGVLGLRALGAVGGTQGAASATHIFGDCQSSEHGMSHR